MCLVTIGLPVFNAAPFLADAIQSVLNQTLTDWELLIVDDGSTDGSQDIARFFTDPRIQVLADGVNRGVATRLNQIARLAKGHYLARMDADDIMLPDRLQTQVDFMESNPGIDVVGSFAYIIDTGNQVYGIRGTTDVPTTFAQASGGVSLIHPTVLARTNWFANNSYRDDCRRAEDFELWLRTVDTTAFHVIDAPLVYYREQGLPALKKYIETAADVRAVLRRRKNSLTPWRFVQLMLMSYMKETVYRLADLLEKTDWLVRGRNRLLSPEEWQTAQAILNQAIRTQVHLKLAES